MLTFIRSRIRIMGVNSRNSGQDLEWKIIINAEVEKWDTFSLCSKHRQWMLLVQEIISLLIESIVWARIMLNTSERLVQIRNVRLDFFNKPADAAYTEGSELPYPMSTENLNHEIELVVTIGKKWNKLIRVRGSGLCVWVCSRVVFDPSWPAGRG